MDGTCKIDKTNCDASKVSKETYDKLFETDLTIDVWTEKAQPLVKDYEKDCEERYDQDDVGFFQAIWNYY